MFSFGRVRSRGADRRAFTDSLLGGSAEKVVRRPDGTAEITNNKGSLRYGAAEFLSIGQKHRS